MGWGPKAPDMSGANEQARMQSGIAKEQWEMTKAERPRMLALAERDDARSQRMADMAESDSAYYRGISQDQYKNSLKYRPYEDQMLGITNKYASGAMEREQVDEAVNDASASTQQAISSMQPTFSP